MLSWGRHWGLSCRGAVGTGLTGCAGSPSAAPAVTHTPDSQTLVKYIYSRPHSSQLNIRTSSLISNPSASWGFLSSCARASCCAGRGGDATSLRCNCQVCLFACIYTDIYLEISSRQKKVIHDKQQLGRSSGLLFLYHSSPQAYKQSLYVLMLIMLKS